MCRIAEFSVSKKKERMRTLDIQPGFQQVPGGEHSLRELERRTATLDEETDVRMI